jgi:hypothetical protein
VDRLTLLLIFLLVALIGLGILALFRGWLPFGG